MRVKLTVYVDVDVNALPCDSPSGYRQPTEQTVLDEVVSNLESLDYVRCVPTATSEPAQLTRVYQS